MQIAKDLLDTPISVFKNGVYLTNEWGSAEFYACRCTSFKYYFFAQIDFTEVDKTEEEKIVNALKAKVPKDFKEVPAAPQLEPHTYCIGIRHPSRPLVEPDMSCISFIFGARNK